MGDYGEGDSTTTCAKWEEVPKPPEDEIDVYPDGRRARWDGIIDIEKPRYDQETYCGRAKHFFSTTNPLNLFVSSAELERAKTIVQTIRNKERLDEPLFEDEVWRAKTLYDSAFHPDTGEKMLLIGRMSAQVPCNMFITGNMLTFYKNTYAVIFWQWFNQSFNAVVNYTNRSGDSPTSEERLFVSYVAATGTAVGTAIKLNSMVTKMPPLVGRIVPFVAVAAANCINIPLMRSQELIEGTPVYHETTDERLGNSKKAAASGIAQVVVSRIAMATPGLTGTTFLMDYLEKRGTLCRYPWLPLPLQLAVIGLCLTFATPLACAFFKQNAEIKFTKLEPKLQEEIKEKLEGKVPKYVYYNKGL